MNKFMSLTKLQLKDFFSRYQSGLNLKKGILGKGLFIVVGLLLLFPAIQLSQSLYTPLAMVGYPQILVTLAYIGAVIAMLFAAIPFIMSIFFYSKDITFLSSLPIKESAIVLSKLSAIYIYLLGMSAFIFGPALAIYTINQEMNILLILLSLIAFIVSPILPLTIATLIILPIMRWVGGSKRRNLFSILGSILFLFFIVALQLILSRFQSDPERMQQLLAQPEGLLKAVGKPFPPSLWLTNMIQGSFVDMILFLGITIILVLLLQGLSKAIYRKAMMSFSQEGSVSIKEGSIYYKKRSVGLQLIRRNFFIITSNPTFFLNTFLNMLVPVLVFGISMFTGETSIEALNSPLLAPYRVLIFAGVLSSPAIISNISATAITREGKAFWETKVLPISLKDNLRYRVITTMILNLFGSLLLGIGSMFIMDLSAMDILLGIVVTISLTLFLATVDIVINIFRPMLNWTHPTAAVKNNMNVMISLALRVVIGFGIYGIFMVVKAKNETMIILISGIFFLLYLLARHLVYKVFVKKFKEISI